MHKLISSRLLHNEGRIQLISVCVIVRVCACGCGCVNLQPCVFIRQHCSMKSVVCMLTVLHKRRQCGLVLNAVLIIDNALGKVGYF